MGFRPRTLWRSALALLALSACDRPASRSAADAGSHRVVDSSGGSIASPLAAPKARRTGPTGAAMPAVPASTTALPTLDSVVPVPPSLLPTVNARVPGSMVQPAPAPTAAPVSGDPVEAAVSPAITGRHFGPGERLTYNVKYGFFHAGDAALEVIGADLVRGLPALHTRFTVSGGTRFFHVDDDYESWFDPRAMASLRYTQRVDEGNYKANRDYEIYPADRTFTENGGSPLPSVAEPLDEASFIYFLRTIPLEVGKTYDFDRYFRPDRNPVRVTVLRREQVTVPAGTFNTIVVRPIIKAKGLFGEGGQAELWFTDDSLRTMVQMRSHLPIGSLSLYLTRVQR